MDQIEELLKSKKVEDRIAAVILCSRALESLSSSSSGVVADEKRRELLRLLFHTLPYKDVSTLLQLQKYPPVQKAALNVLLHACGEVVHAAQLSLHRQVLVETFFLFAANNSYDQQRKDLETLLLHLVMAISDKEAVLLFREVFAEGCKQARTCPHVIVGLLSDLCGLLTPSTPITLTESEGTFLQSCLIQGLYGAAQEPIRDSTLKAALELLRSPHILHPDWILRKISLNKSSSDMSVDASSSSSLLSLLCTIVYGELHLVEEELLYFADLAAAAPAREESKGDLTDVQRKAKSLRNMKMFYVCMDLVDWIVSSVLLSGDEEDSDADRHGLDINFFELQQLQKDLHKIVKEMWEYFMSCSSIIGAVAVNDEACAEVVFLRLTVSRAVDTLQQLVFEDAELRRQLFANLENIIKCSMIASRGYSLRDLSASVRLEDGAVVAAGSSTSRTSSEIREEDVLCKLLPIVSTILQDLVYDAFTQNQPFDEEADAIVEKACEQCSTLVLFANALIQQSAVGEPLEASIKALRIILAVKESALKTLIRGEGVLAFQELLHCPAAAFQLLHANLHQLLNQCPSTSLTLRHDAEELQTLLVSCSELELSIDDLEQL